MGVTCTPIHVKGILTRNPNPARAHTWSLNPWRGCPFGCRYCFARYTARYMGHQDPLDFERRLYYKANAIECLGRLTEAHFTDRPVLLSPVSDAWQPLEAKQRITRRILEALVRFRSLDLTCMTKSPLIERDVDVLSDLHRRATRLAVGISVASLDDRFARAHEPQAPRPARRLAAMAKLAAAGIPVYVMVMPIVAGGNDAETSILSVLRAARNAGAGRAEGRGLLASARGFSQGRFTELCREAGFPAESEDRKGQLSLFGK